LEWMRLSYFCCCPALKGHTASILLCHRHLESCTARPPVSGRLEGEEYMRCSKRGGFDPPSLVCHGKALIEDN
jgi:hypothetical protein